MKRFFNIAAVFASLALLAVPVARAQTSQLTPVAFRVGLVVDMQAQYKYQYKLDVSQVWNGAVYRSLSITYPKELIILAEALAGTWSCTETPGAASLIVTGYNASGQPNSRTFTQVQEDLNKVWFSLRTQDPVPVYPPQGSKIGIQGSSDKVAVYVDSDGKVHYYEFIPYAASDGANKRGWQDAYARVYLPTAQGYVGHKTVNTVNGQVRMRPYLATITSQDEQYMLFNTIADRSGWLGGTRLRHKSGNVSGSGTGNYIKFRDYFPGGTSMGNAVSDYSSTGTDPNRVFSGAFDWYWSGGPEAYTIPNPAFTNGVSPPNVKSYILVDPGFDHNSTTQFPLTPPNPAAATAQPLVFYSIPVTWRMGGNVNDPWANGAVPGVYNAFDNMFNKDIHGRSGKNGSSTAQHPFPANKTLNSTVGALAPSGAPNKSDHCLKFAWDMSLNPRGDLWGDEGWGDGQTMLEGFYIEYGGYPNDPDYWDLADGNIAEAEMPVPSTVSIHYRMAVKDGSGNYTLIDFDEGKEGDFYDFLLPESFDGFKYTVKALAPANLPDGLYISGYDIIASEKDIEFTRFDPNASPNTISGIVSDTLHTIIFLYSYTPCKVLFDVNTLDHTAAVSPTWMWVTPGSEYGAQFALPTPRRQGYTFDGWFYDALCSGDAVTNQTIVATSQDHTLYARWKANSAYEVRYELDGGHANIGGSQTNEIPARTGVSWLDTNLLPQGVTCFDLGYEVEEGMPEMIFVAWVANIRGARVVVTPGMAFHDIAPHADVTHITLSAVWAENYKVFYNMNGADSAPEIELDVFNDEINGDGRESVNVIPQNEPVRLGYIFKGWVLEDRGDGESGGNPTLFKRDGGDVFFEVLALYHGPGVSAAYIQLKAEWEVDETPRTVRYWYNFDGSQAVACDVQTNVLLTALIPIPPPGGDPSTNGWLFVGWNTKKDGSGTTVERARYMDVAGDTEPLDLFAQWVRIVYTVYYDLGDSPDANDPKYAPRNVLFTQDGLVSTNSPPAAPMGYFFKNWAVSVNGKWHGNVMDDHTFGFLAAVDALNITIKAVYIAKGPYDVYFNLNGHNFGNAPDWWGARLNWDGVIAASPTDNTQEILVVGKQYGKPGDVQKVFMGWNTAPDGTGYQWQDGDTYGKVAAQVPQDDTAAVLRLYAQWVNVGTRLATFDINEGALLNPGATPTGFENWQWTTANPVVPLPNPATFARLGYAFTGWSVRTNSVEIGVFDPANPVTASVNCLALPNGIDIGAAPVVTFQAIWTPLTFFVVYNSNFPGGGVSTNSPVAWNQTGLDNWTPASMLRGHIHQGWTNSAGRVVYPGDTFAILAGNTVPATGHITLYAIWFLSDLYRVDYDLGYAGAPSPPASIYVAPHDDHLLPGMVPNRVGYDFAGWDCVESPLVKNIDDTKTYLSIAGSDKVYKITLIARWERRYLTDQWIVIREILLPEDSAAPDSAYALLWDEEQIEVPEPRVHIIYTTDNLDGAGVAWEPLPDNDPGLDISVSRVTYNEAPGNMALIPVGGAESARFFKARVFAKNNPLFETELQAGAKNTISAKGNIVGLDSIAITKTNVIVGVNFEACETGFYTPLTAGLPVAIQDAIPYVKGMTADADPCKADYFKVISASGTASYYWLNENRQWVKRDEEPARVIETLQLGSGFWYHSRKPCPNFVLKIKGQVRTTATVQLELPDPYTLFASPYPASLPFSTTITNRPNSGMVANSNTALADNIQVQAPNYISYTVYYLHNGAVGRITDNKLKNTWVKSTESTPTADSLPRAKGAWYKSVGTPPVFLTVPRPFLLDEGEAAEDPGEPDEPGEMQMSFFQTMSMVFGFAFGTSFDADPFPAPPAKTTADETDEDEWIRITSFSVDADGIAGFEIEYNFTSPKPRFFVHAGEDLAEINDWPAHEVEAETTESKRSGTQSARIQFNPAEKMKLRGTPAAMFFKVGIE